MKKLLLTSVILSAHILMYGQYGYKYQEKYIELTPDKSAPILVQIDEADTLQLNNFKKLAGKTVFTNSVNQMSSNRFVVGQSDKNLANGFYSSETYKTSDGHTCMILPQIVLSSKSPKAIEQIKNLFGNQVVIKQKAKSIYALDCKVNNSEEILRMIPQIESLNDIEWCEPDMISDVRPASWTNNPLWSYQWYISNVGGNGGTAAIDICASTAWNLVEGSPDITVAVIDMGVDTNHEDLSNCVLQGYTVGNPTGYGAPENTNIYDNKAHGMACAGIIAANNNTIGIAGVAYGVKILPVNIFPNYAAYNYAGSASSSEIADAIRWAYQRADVLSCSWGGGSYSSDIDSAIQDARTYGRNGLGCVVVFAAGNNYASGTTDVAFPASVTGVLAVGALDNNGNICTYSQRGPSLDVMAFGGYDDIVTTDRMGSLGYNNGNYMMTFDGTSAACPQVAGVAALILSAAPYLTENEVCAGIMAAAKDLGAPGRDDTYGYGLVDAGYSVTRAKPEIYYSGSYSNAVMYAVNSMITTRLTYTWYLSTSGNAQIQSVINWPNSSTCIITNSGPACNATLTVIVSIDGNTVKTLTKNVVIEQTVFNKSSVNISRNDNFVTVSLDLSEAMQTDVRGTNNTSTTWSLTISDSSTGRKVYTNNVEGKKCDVPISNWKHGTYIVNVCYKGERVTKKISI